MTRPEDEINIALQETQLAEGLDGQALGRDGGVGAHVGEGVLGVGAGADRPLQQAVQDGPGNVLLEGGEVQAARHVGQADHDVLSDDVEVVPPPLVEGAGAEAGARVGVLLILLSPVVVTLLGGTLGIPEINLM